MSVSRDRGDTWERFGLSDTVPGWCHALAIAPGATSSIYAAGQVAGNGAVYRSSDLGRTWQRSATAPPGTVRSLAVNPRDAAELYAAADRLYRSTDSGESWSWCAAGIGLRSVRFHPDFPDTIVAGGDSGVVISYDGGESWSELNDGLECRDISWLEFADDGAKLVAATHGRSCFAWSVLTGVADIGSPFRQEQGLEAFPSPGRGPVSLRSARGSISGTVKVIDCTGRVVWTCRLGQGSAFSTLVLPELPAGVYRLEIQDRGQRASAQLVRL